MTKGFAAAAVLVAAQLAQGCKTSGQSAPPEQGSGGAEVTKSGVKFTQPAEEGSSGTPRALKWAATPFENVVYLPWKFVGGGCKGAVDGVGAGFAEGRMPFLGALFSPVNLVAGFLTGAVEGVALPPVLVGPDDSFGYAMSQPTKHPTTIWWYQ